MKVPKHKNLYTMATTSVFIVWESETEFQTVFIGTIFPNAIYTRAYSIPQAIYQFKKRIQEATLYDINSIEISKFEIQYLLEE